MELLTGADLGAVKASGPTDAQTAVERPTPKHTRAGSFTVM
jgi:hypothetical protein